MGNQSWGNQPYAGSSSISNNDAGTALFVRLHSHGALAYSPSTGRYGRSYWKGDQATAGSDALDLCGTRDARIECWGFDTCIALAVADNGAYAAVWDNDPTRAQLRAAKACDGPNFRIAALFHTRNGDLKPDDLPKVLRKRRRNAMVLSILCGVGALAFAIGGISDVLSPHSASSGVPSFVIAAVFAILTIHQRHKALSSR
jgi:hypothetical protein